LGSAPLLMTLVSRPVLGQVQCYSGSALMSIPTSANAKVNYCSGHTPAWWAQNTDQWPGSILAQDKVLPNGKIKSATLFSDCFVLGPYTSTLAGQTYLQVLQSTGAPAYFAAALLNVMKDLVPVLTEDSLKLMWQEYSQNGTYQPSAGATPWSETQLIQYFQSTTV
jgi:hypothetical protein